MIIVYYHVLSEPSIVTSLFRGSNSQDFFQNKIYSLNADGTTSFFSTFNGGGQIYLKFDSSDNLYVADPGQDKIYKITPQGLISTFAGSTRGNQDSN
tara:strand:+ start:223 stop:513 length:291 start_codon:yes stop_codon:yes gene_type:complete